MRRREAIGAQEMGAVGVRGPGAALVAPGDFQRAGAAVCVALDAHFQESLGGGKTAQPAPDAPLDLARVFGRTALEARVGFIQLRAQPLALALEHRELFFAPRPGAVEHVLFAGRAIGMRHYVLLPRQAGPAPNLFPRAAPPRRL